MQLFRMAGLAAIYSCRAVCERTSFNGGHQAQVAACNECIPAQLKLRANLTAALCEDNIFQYVTSLASDFQPSWVLMNLPYVEERNGIGTKLSTARVQFPTDRK